MYIYNRKINFIYLDKNKILNKHTIMFINILPQYNILNTDFLSKIHNLHRYNKLSFQQNEIFFFNKNFYLKQYRCFLDLFYSFFFNKINILFLNFYGFDDEIAIFNSYLYGAYFNTFFKNFFIFLKKKKYRSYILYFLFKLIEKFKLAGFMFFSYKYSKYFSFFFKQLDMFFIGIQQGEYLQNYFDYSVFVINNDFFIKFIIFNNLLYIYNLTQYHKSLYYIKIYFKIFSLC